MVPVRRSERNWLAYLAAGGLILGYLLLQRSNPNHENSLRSKQQSYSKNGPKKSAPAKAYEDYEHASDKAHQTAEQYNWRSLRNIGAATLVFTVIAAFSTALAFWQTKRQADIAQTALISSSRAWINIEVNSLSASLSWMGDVPTVTVSLIGRNEGASPAIDVQIFPVLYFPQSGTAGVIRDATRKHCRGLSQLGNIVFIKDELKILESASLDDNLTKSWLKSVRKEITSLEPVPLPLGIILCAVYKIVGDDGLHHTARLYEIGMMAGGGLTTPFVGRPLSKGELQMERDFEGEYAD